MSAQFEHFGVEGGGGNNSNSNGNNDNTNNSNGNNNNNNNNNSNNNSVHERNEQSEMREEILRRAATLDLDTLERRELLKNGDYRRACEDQWDETEGDGERPEKGEINVLDVLTQTRLRENDAVVLSDGKCYSREGIFQLVQAGVVNLATARARLPLTNKEMTDLDYALVGSVPPTTEEQRRLCQYRTYEVQDAAFDVASSAPARDDEQSSEHEQTQSLPSEHVSLPPESRLDINAVIRTVLESPEIGQQYARWKREARAEDFQPSFTPFLLFRADGSAVAERLFANNADLPDGLEQVFSRMIGWLRVFDSGERYVPHVVRLVFNTPQVRRFRTEIARGPSAAEPRRDLSPQTSVSFARLLVDVFTTAMSGMDRFYTSEELEYLMREGITPTLTYNDLLLIDRAAERGNHQPSYSIAWSVFDPRRYENVSNSLPVGQQQQTVPQSLSGAAPDNNVHAANLFALRRDLRDVKSENMYLIPWPRLLARFGELVLQWPPWSTATRSQRRFAVQQLRETPGRLPLSQRQWNRQLDILAQHV